MIARPNWFWSSLFSSLTVNAVMFVSAACYLYSRTPIWEPGWPDGTSAAPADDASPVFIPKLPDTLLGDSAGKGTATDAAPGETPMEARLGDQDQSFLSRDPEGPGHIGDPPSMSTQLPGENGNGTPGQPMKFGVSAADESASANPIFPQPTQTAQPNTAQSTAAQQTAAQQTDVQKPDAQQADAKQSDAKQTDEKPSDSTSDANNTTVAPSLIAQSTDTDSPQPKPATEPVVDWRSAVASVAEASPLLQPQTNPAQPTPAPQQQSPPQPQQQPQQSANSSAAGGGKPGPAQAPADPAPQSDTESDPFSAKGAVKFKQGSTAVQFGRKHKLVRPQLGLAAQTALLQLRQPVILILALSLDETGKVTRVTVLQSSGSADIDQACKVAAYQWWLEPSKDKDGKPVKDVIPFTIGFS